MPKLPRVFAMLLAVLLGVGHASALEPLDPDQLRNTLTQLLDAHPATRRTNVTLKVVDLATGSVLFDRGGDKLFTPASNLKIYTSAAALALLGPDYRWTTTLATTQPRRGLPTVELLAGGDPMFDTEQLATLTDTLLKATDRNQAFAGVRVVTAEPWADVPIKGPGWMWDDDPDYYNMSITQMMLNFNVLGVTFSALPEPMTTSEDPWQRAGLLVRYDPPSSYPPRDAGYLSRVKSGVETSATPVSISRPDFEHALELHGRPAVGGKPASERITMQDPDLYAASVLERLLEQRGHKVGEAQETFDGDGHLPEPVKSQDLKADPAAVDRQHIFTQQGKTLTQAIRHFLRESENAVGEMVLLTLAEKFSDNQKASWPGGAKVISDWLIHEAGLEEGSFKLIDGSGLSRYNLISADSSVKLLAYMKSHPCFDAFFDGLPKYKVKLPADDSFAGQPLASVDPQRVFAKPGGMASVSTISGYVQTLDGRWLAFSFLGNGFAGPAAPVRDLRDQVWAALVRYRIEDTHRTIE